MSFWDRLKPFTQPYAEDEYDEYEEEEVVEGFEEPAAPARQRRTPIFNFSSAEEEPAASASAPAERPATKSSAFSGQVVSMGGKQEVVLFHPANFNDTSTAADHLRNK